MISEKQLQQLTNAFNKNQLEAGLFNHVKKFYVQHMWDIEKVLPGYEKAKIAVEKLKEKKQLTKPNLDLVCFSVFDNKEVYALFVKTLPEPVTRLIEILLWQDTITHTAAEKELKVKLLEEQKNSYYAAKLKKEFYFFAVTEHDNWGAKGYTKDYTLSIPRQLRQVLAEYYPKPENYYFKPVDTLPEGGYNVFTAEKQVFVEMPAILSYHLQASIKYTNTGRPNDASVNKMQRSCNLAEFYQQELFKNIRSQMIAGMLHNLQLKDINIDSTQLLKTLFTEHYKKVYTPQFILNHFKGWQYVSQYYLEDTSFGEMLDTIKQLPQDKWISAENLHGYIKSRSVDIKGVEPVVIHNSLSFNEAFITAGQAATISVDKIGKLAYINGAVFLLAAFGLVEIAYTNINTKKFGETFFTSYDGLAYLKLNPLGAYILGLAKNYVPQHTGPKNKLHFSEDSLTIVAEGDLAVIDIMLSKFTQKEGPGRYRATTAEFFKDCKNLAAVEAKIAVFKKTISTKLPRYWDACFAEWKANARLIEPKGGLYIFQVPAAAKNLHSLFARDVVLKGITLKAEGFHVLVEAGNVANFKQRLKELGYFIE